MASTPAVIRLGRPLSWNDERRCISAFAPGRVELLGNHTDYNEGVVLGAAIDRGLTVQRRSSRRQPSSRSHRPMLGRVEIDGARTASAGRTTAGPTTCSGWPASSRAGHSGCADFRLKSPAICRPGPASPARLRSKSRPRFFCSSFAGKSCRGSRSRRLASARSIASRACNRGCSTRSLRFSAKPITPFSSTAGRKKCARSRSRPGSR